MINFMAQCIHLATEVKSSDVSKIEGLTVLSVTSEQEHGFFVIAVATALLDGWKEYLQIQSFGGGGELSWYCGNEKKLGRTKLTL